MQSSTPCVNPVDVFHAPPHPVRPPTPFLFPALPAWESQVLTSFPSLAPDDGNRGEKRTASASVPVFKESD